MGKDAESEGLDIDSVMDSVAAGMAAGGDAGADAAGDDAGGADAGTQGGQDTGAEEFLPAPQSWKKEMHGIWDKLEKGEPLTREESRQATRYYNEREKQMLAGLEGYKGDAGYGRTLREAIKPFTDVLKAQGVDEVKAVTFLLNAHKGLSDPRTAKDWYARIAKSYGIEAAQAAADAAGGAAAGGQQDPAVQALMAQVQEIRGHLTEQQQREYEARVASTSKEVEAFASDPAHPYFDECGEHIAKLIAAGYSLKDAYEAAVWANPVTRQKELGRIEKERAEEQRKKTAEAANSARRAAKTNVKGRDTARASTEPAGSMDDTLRETLAEIKSRT